MVVIAIPALIALFLVINRHYRTVSRRLRAGTAAVRRAPEPTNTTIHSMSSISTRRRPRQPGMPARSRAASTTPSTCPTTGRSPDPRSHWWEFSGVAARPSRPSSGATESQTRSSTTSGRCRAATRPSPQWPFQRSSSGRRSPPPSPAAARRSHSSAASSRSRAWSSRTSRSSSMQPRAAPTRASHRPRPRLGSRCGTLRLDQVHADTRPGRRQSGLLRLRRRRSKRIQNRLGARGDRPTARHRRGALSRPG